MLIFKVLSLLLSYPQAEMLDALDEMGEVVDQEPRLSQPCKRSLQALLANYHGVDLLDVQEDYVALFDRGRFLSLHIFEHVHGESRDRGQAMVNLLEMYQSHGFEMDSRELPDYLPLFLEFLSQLPSEQEALQLLQDAMPVLSLLGARLNERGSQFAAIFDALADLAGEPEEIETIRQQAASEGDDETLLNIDAIWEEEAVSFMANTSCNKAQSDSSPINITPREQFTQLRNHSLHGG
ncbi:nitrate reductase molybdenum cofactor assembly chaperone [Methylomonas methanica]|uniref:Nitrate reductase molybdenum cofactor assembly chaperone n=1 Tax=Methylomonas methanica TaxID=421 RepID=A0A177MRU2_METMH|nr:nitrate reductase molybdenum cofactor assembly chaperone [Methylomonas methanica]OAI08205.1 nitrate reductase molybdenum cofactor assembly chaperone [Methylomonas methanica]